MSQRVIDPENATLNRRHVLKGIAATGVVATAAGCLGDDDADDTAPGDDDDDTGPADDGDDAEPPELTFPYEVQIDVNADNTDRVEMVEVVAETMNETGYFDATVETFEWEAYVQRVLDPAYGERGVIGCIGLSGTFNPESFCNALHHSANVGACCNLVGVNDPELDDMMDSARFGADVAEDPDLRRERYDEVWDHLAEERYSSIVFFGQNEAVTNNSVHGFDIWPFNEGILEFALYSPQEEQVTWIDDDADPRDTDLSDLQAGGTLTVGAAENPASFDPPYSTDTTSSLAQSLIFEGLTTTDLEGNVQPWLAESFDIVDTQDIDATAYEDYMETLPATEEGAIDTDEQIIVVHPEDDPVGEDEVRVLLPDGAADAAADDVYGMQIRYELHEGVMFHNDEELSAEHVVRTAEYYHNSDLAPQTFDSVLHVEEVDEYTVDIFGQLADAEGQRELPGFSILSLENIEDADPAADADPDEEDIIDPRSDITPYGTGPYTLDEFSDEEFAEYSKFDDYWVEDKGVDAIEWFDGSADFPDGPVIDEIILEFIPDDATRSAALQNEEVDMAYGLETDTFDDYDASDDFILHSVEAGGYDYIQTPVNLEPWSDSRMRHAFNHLINREFIVENVLNGYGREAWTDLPELAQGLGTQDPADLEDRIRPYNEYDMDEAMSLIQEVIDDHGYDSTV